LEQQVEHAFDPIEVIDPEVRRTMDSRKEAKIAGLGLAAIYVMCHMFRAYGMN
jgi:hypothetical protein